MNFASSNLPSLVACAYLVYTSLTENRAVAKSFGSTDCAVGEIYVALQVLTLKAKTTWTFLHFFLERECRRIFAKFLKVIYALGLCVCVWGGGGEGESRCLSLNFVFCLIYKLIPHYIINNKNDWLKSMGYIGS